MLSKTQKNIIVRAVKIRLNRGEELEKIINSYTKLTTEEIEEISSMVLEILDR